MVCSVGDACPGMQTIRQEDGDDLEIAFIRQDCEIH